MPDTTTTAKEARDEAARDGSALSPSSGGLRRVVRVVAWVLLLCLAVGTGTRILGPSAEPLVAVAGLAPFVGLGYLLPLASAVPARSRVLALLSVLGLAVHTAWAAPLFIADHTESGPTGEGRLTVMSVNMEYGRADARDIVRLVREADVDLLSVQELTTDAVPRLRAAGLDRLLPYEHIVPSPTTPAGSGLWSRYPLSDRHRLEPASFRNLSAVVNVQGHRVTMLAVHPYPPVGPDGEELWRRDYATLEAGLARLDGPVVVAGDFNATQDHRPFRRLLGLGYTDAAEADGAGLMLTWPARGGLPPLLSLDHVLVKGDVSVVEVVKAPVAGNDHFAVIATLDSGFLFGPADGLTP